MKVISLIIVGVVIIYLTITGFYDFNPVTTKEIRNSYQKFVNKSLRLKLIRILGYKIYRLENGIIIIELDIFNGRTKFSELNPDERNQWLKESIKVFAKVTDENSEFLHLIKNGSKVMSEVQVRVLPDVIFLEKYSLLFGESLFTYPYLTSFLFLNAFLPFNVSNFIAMSIETAVLIIIGILVVKGFIYIMPSL